MSCFARNIDDLEGTNTMNDEWAATTVKPKDQEYTDKGLSKHLNKIASKGYRVTKTWHNTFSNHIFKIYCIEQLIGMTKMGIWITQFRVRTQKLRLPKDHIIDWIQRELGRFWDRSTDSNMDPMSFPIGSKISKIQERGDHRRESNWFGWGGVRCVIANQ